MRAKNIPEKSMRKQKILQYGNSEEASYVKKNNCTYIHTYRYLNLKPFRWIPNDIKFPYLIKQVKFYINILTIRSSLVDLPSQNVVTTGMFALLEVSEGIDIFAAGSWYVLGQLSGRAPACIAGYFCSNPGSGIHFSLKL